mgnify:CR=1 FL=1
MKKILSVLVLAAMLLSALAIACSAEEYDYVNQADYYEHEAVKRDEVYDEQAGIASQVVAEINDRAILSLEAPVLRVTAPDTVFAFSQAEPIWLQITKMFLKLRKKFLSFNFIQRKSFISINGKVEAS